MRNDSTTLATNKIYRKTGLIPKPIDMSRLAYLSDLFKICEMEGTDELMTAEVHKLVKSFYSKFIPPALCKAITKAELTGNIDEEKKFGYTRVEGKEYRDAYRKFKILQRLFSLPKNMTAAEFLDRKTDPEINLLNHLYCR